MIISARIVWHPRKERVCWCCRHVIKGAPILRVFGTPKVGGSACAIYTHPQCMRNADARIIRALADLPMHLINPELHRHLQDWRQTV